MAFVGRSWVVRLTPEGALVAAAVVGVVRWVMMMGDPTGPLLLVLQISHAVTFGLAHLGMMTWITDRLEERLAASALALSNALVGGAAMASVMLASAALYPIWGGTTFALAAGFSAISLVAGLMLMGQRRGELE